VSEQHRISVLIPLYRGRSTVRECLESLISQEGVGLEILMIDNGCPEDTGEWAGYYLSGAKWAPPWKLLEVPRNIGFAAGINRLYEMSAMPYVLFLNQDVTLQPGHLKALVDSLAENSGWGGVCGTLYRSKDSGGPKIIDTTGHVIFRDRIVRNRGTGLEIKPEEPLPWEEGEVFGISAACALYKREALESAREPEGPFDPDFFAYFEDIDLDYRLHRGGWKLGYVPSAEGFHALAGSGARKERTVRIRAYGNRRRVMWKHESVSSLAPDFIPIITQEIYGWVRALYTDPIAWLVGPWMFLSTFPGVIGRRRRLDAKFGTDRKWIRQWLHPETERWRSR
jgi:GT2 family glycosyltransferase